MSSDDVAVCYLVQAADGLPFSHPSVFLSLYIFLLIPHSSMQQPFVVSLSHCVLSVYVTVQSLYSRSLLFQSHTIGIDNLLIYLGKQTVNMPLASFQIIITVSQICRGGNCYV